MKMWTDREIVLAISLAGERLGFQGNKEVMLAFMKVEMCLYLFQLERSRAGESKGLAC